MVFPFEIMLLIYDYLDIDSRIKFYKLFGHRVFLPRKLQPMQPRFLYDLKYILYFKIFYRSVLLAIENNRLWKTFFIAFKYKYNNAFKMSSYTFNKQINLFAAFDDYMHKNNAPLYDSSSYDGGSQVVTINTTAALSQDQQDALAVLVNNYFDPPYFMDFSRTQAYTLHSHWTQETDQALTADGKTIMQTIIYSGNVDGSNVANPNEYLDAFKTVFEYNTPNVQNYANITSCNLEFEIFDVTRNVTIMSREVDITPIASQWNALAQTGSTSASTIYRTEYFNGLMNKSPGYDCIWNFNGRPCEVGRFDFRINAYQEIYYNKITPSG